MNWVENEVKTIDLGDASLNVRMAKILCALIEVTPKCLCLNITKAEFCDFCIF